MKKVSSFILLITLALCSGCSSWEKTTLQSLSASRDVINAAHADYVSGKIPQTQNANDVITKAVAVQKTATDAFLAYWLTKTSATSTPDQVTNAQVAVVTALATIPPILADIKSLYPTGGK